MAMAPDAYKGIRGSSIVPRVLCLITHLKPNGRGGRTSVRRESRGRGVRMGE